MRKTSQAGLGNWAASHAGLEKEAVSDLEIKTGSACGLETATASTEASVEVRD